jgi:hypothetical protein
MTALDHRPAVRVHGPYDDYAAACADVESMFYLGGALGTGVRPAVEVARLAYATLSGSLAAHRVALGGYDMDVASQIGQFEPQIIAVVAGWIERAYSAGQDSILGGVQSMLDDPAAVLGRDVRLIRCAATGCQNVELLPVGSTLLCPDHGGEHHDIKTGA